MATLANLAKHKVSFEENPFTTLLLNKTKYFPQSRFDCRSMMVSESAAPGWISRNLAARQLFDRQHTQPELGLFRQARSLTSSSPKWVRSGYFIPGECGGPLPN